MSSTPPSGLMSERDDAMEAVADVEAGPETCRITHLFAGVSVSDLDASVDWYTRLFRRPLDRRVGHEMLWEMDEHAWLFIEPNATRADGGRITRRLAGSTRSWGASRSRASSTNRSRPTRMACAT